MWLCVAALPWQPHRVRERLRPAAGPVDLSGVTVLIPARNEAELIEATLRGLTQQGPELHVRVVDDESTDATADRVRALAAELGSAHGTHARYPLTVELLAGRALPPDWGGKLWALQQGLEAGCREYTLLLDADIVLEPHVLPALLATAERRPATLVSIMARLRNDSTWERLLVPAFIFFFRLLYPFELAAKPRSRVAAAAGGCILVATRALEQIGGFASFRAALIDDCALAGAIKAHGGRLWIGLSDAVRSRRRYARLVDFWQMVRRTAFTQLRYSTVLLAATTALMVWLFVLPFAALATGDAGTRGVALLTWAGMAGVYLPTVRAYGQPWPWALSLPFAAALMLAMTWSSAIDYWNGTRAQWKARTYSTH